MNEIKIGRWTYPLAVKDGVVVRNAKRDGSGEWLVVEDKQMTQEDRDTLLASAKPEKEVAKTDDYWTLRDIYRFIFDSFATDYDEIAAQFDLRPGRAKAAVSRLVRFGLVATDRRKGIVSLGEGKGVKEITETHIQSLHTYDEISQYEALANYDEAVPNNVRIPNPSTHGGVKGAQTKKPGHSTWKVGAKCPQGHVLRKQDIYHMPSGRNICRRCRSEYKSVQARAAGSKGAA